MLRKFGIASIILSSACAELSPCDSAGGGLTIETVPGAAELAVRYRLRNDGIEVFRVDELIASAEFPARSDVAEGEGFGFAKNAPPSFGQGGDPEVPEPKVLDVVDEDGRHIFNGSVSRTGIEPISVRASADEPLCSLADGRRRFETKSVFLLDLREVIDGLGELKTTWNARPVAAHVLEAAALEGSSLSTQTFIVAVE